MSAGLGILAGIALSLSLRLYERYRGPLLSWGTIPANLQQEIRNRGIMASDSDAMMMMSTAGPMGWEPQPPLPARVPIARDRIQTLGLDALQGWVGELSPPPIRDQDLWAEQEIPAGE